MKENYRIPLVWQMYGHVWVEAESEEEAIEIALNSKEPLPEGTYVYGSRDVDDSCPIETESSLQESNIVLEDDEEDRRRYMFEEYFRRGLDSEGVSLSEFMDL